MPRSRNILILTLLLGLAACTQQSVPYFEEPFPMAVRTDGQSLGPRLAQNSSTTTLSWMERAEKGATLKFARYQDGKWRDITAVTRDERMFVNWADKPAVTPLGGASFLAHWLRYSADGRYSYDVMLSQSTDDGESWGEPFSPHDDGTPTEHGFVSLYPDDDDTGLIWLDGRNTPDAGMSLRTANIGKDGTVSNAAELDDLVCDCCQTDVAVSSDGPVAVYRDRSPDEVRDIYVARRVDGTWQPGVAVADDGWVIKGCPVNGPAIDALGRFVVVTWFSAANDKPLVQAAVSTNAGRSFGEPVVIAQRKALGRVGLAIVNEHSYVVSWMESDGNGSFDIQLRGLTADGQLGNVWNVGKTSEMMTVPQLVRHNDKLVMAWTDSIADVSQVVSVRMQLLDFYE